MGRLEDAEAAVAAALDVAEESGELREPLNNDTVMFLASVLLTCTRVIRDELDAIAMAIREAGGR